MAKKTNTATADVKPVVHAKTDLFTYETDMGPIRLPYLENVPVRILEDHAEDPFPVFLAAVLEEFLDEEATKVRREMTIHEFNTMIDKWVVDSGLTLGEPGALAS
ncbi:hypothetical protein [Trueperella pyogenes]|uniref:hypothetical protein n=1 Tax=Trueperella pyogenes TaxID=1661 RepID=UPI0023DDB304|nr:hypothetical protein [Trueperella pyogenes]